MLLVRTQIGQSALHGLGLYAAEEIPAGTVLWRFTPGFDMDKDPADLENLPEHVKEFMVHHGYLDRQMRRFVLCFDNARFINHSLQPNIETDYKMDPWGTDVALVDIHPGDEILADYRQYESEDWGDAIPET